MPTRADGPAIRRLREQRGLTAAQVAAAVGISGTLLSRIEGGLRNGSPLTRLNIASFFGVDPSQITYTSTERRLPDKRAA